MSSEALAKEDMLRGFHRRYQRDHSSNAMALHTFDRSQAGCYNAALLDCVRRDSDSLRNDVNSAICCEYESYMAPISISSGAESHPYMERFPSRLWTQLS